MKNFWYLVLLVISIPGYGQMREFLVTDTAFVSTFKAEDDEYIVVRRNSDTTGRTIVYFDSAHTQKAYEINYTGKFIYSSTTWFPNGQFHHTETRFGIGMCDYEMMSWFEDGKVRIERKCYTDSCVYRSFYHNGQLKKKDIDLPGYYGTLVWARSVEYYENGQLMYTPVDLLTYQIQTITNYYSSGAKKLRKNWSGASVFGTWEEWYENGKVKVKGQYAERDPAYKGEYTLSKKVGTWKYYTEEGKLVKEEFYEDGTLVKTNSY